MRVPRRRQLTKSMASLDASRAHELNECKCACRQRESSCPKLLTSDRMHEIGSIPDVAKLFSRSKFGLALSVAQTPEHAWKCSPPAAAQMQRQQWIEASFLGRFQVPTALDVGCGGGTDALGQGCHAQDCPGPHAGHCIFDLHALQPPRDQTWHLHPQTPQWKRRKLI